MKRTLILVPIAILSITLLACRLSDARSLGAPRIAPQAAESSTETTDLDSSAEGTTLEEFTEPSFGNGANSLFIGHSFFVPVAKAFDVIASQSDFPSHQAEFVFVSGARGTPGMLWDNNSQRQKIDAMLASGDVGLFGMTVTSNNENAYAIYAQWFDLAISYNPNTAFFIGQPWLPGGPEAENEQYAALTETGAQRTMEVITQLRAAYPNNPIYFINYGKIVSMMKIEFEAGNLPDITELVGRNRTSLFVDGAMGHGGHLVHELCALTWINILYGAGVDAVAHADFSEEAMNILLEVIEYNSAFK
jgi:hypothetical protein